MTINEIDEITKSQRNSLESRNLGTERQLLPLLPDINSHALIVSGIRRCGKSTLLHQFVEKINKPFFYLNFDDLRLITFSSTDFKLLDKVIVNSDVKLLFFDEIQSANNWELYIRQKLDEGFQVIITGSNSSLLSQELGSRLTGRHITKELFPFSYDEFCSFFELNKDVESFSNFLEKGGFPEYLRTGNDDILVQLQSDIIFRDIAKRHSIRDTLSLQKLFIYLLSNSSQLFSPSKLTGISGVKSPTTVLEYISYFESSYLIQLLPCFSYSLKSQSLSPKKVYTSDTGLIKVSSISFSSNYGALLENIIYNCLRRNTKEIYYYKSKHGGECDFIVKNKKNISCIQVCWELTPDNKDREINSLLDAMDFFNVNNGEIITFNSEDIINSKGKEIKVIPAYKKIWE